MYGKLTLFELHGSCPKKIETDFLNFRCVSGVASVRNRYGKDVASIEVGHMDVEYNKILLEGLNPETGISEAWEFETR